MNAADQARWRDKTVLVTGATSGLGWAAAERFADGGANVVIHGRSAEAAKSVSESVTSRGGTALISLGDLADPAAADDLVAAAAARFGAVDVIVNNAGANAFTGILDTTLDEWERCMAVDLRAAWLIVKHATPYMSSGSAIVNVTSNHAKSSIPGAFPYNVAKAGMDALTRAMSLDLAPLGLRANAVAPGYIDTPINDVYFGSKPDPAVSRTRAERLHPLGRLGTSQEIAYAIEFLADSRLSGFTTGTVVTIDGGRLGILEDTEGE